MEKSIGNGVETENSFTFGVIGVAVSGPKQATSGLAQLLTVERQPFPVWICDLRVWTTHKGHLVVFITVQNLVGIDGVVSIICRF